MSKTPWTQLWLDYKKVNSKGNEGYVSNVSLEGFEAEHPIIKNALAELALGVQGMLGQEICVISGSADAGLTIKKETPSPD